MQQTKRLFLSFVLFATHAKVRSLSASVSQLLSLFSNLLSVWSSKQKEQFFFLSLLFLKMTRLATFSFSKYWSLMLSASLNRKISDGFTSRWNKLLATDFLFWVFNLPKNFAKMHEERNFSKTTSVIMEKRKKEENYCIGKRASFEVLVEFFFGNLNQQLLGVPQVTTNL